jgi:hypothetical protein
MEVKSNKIHKKLSSNKKDKSIKTFSSYLHINDNQSKEKYKKKNRITQEYKSKKEKNNIRKIETTELSQKPQKAFNQIIYSKLASSKSKNKNQNQNKKKYKKISSIDIINSHNNKKSSCHKIINHSQNKEELTVVKKINNCQKSIGRSANFEIFKIKNPKKNFNLTNLNINYQINNIKTIDTEKVHKSDANKENKDINVKINDDIENDDDKILNKNEFQRINNTPDEIEINTTNQETNNKSGSEKYLSMILFNIKKYKKLNQNYKKENDVLRKENEDLKNKMQDMKDELDIMKEEIELNKQTNKENEDKFKELTEYIKQNEINYEQKIFNLKQLLFSKDQEINKLNKLMESENNKNKKIIEELKIKIANQEKAINDQ